MNKSTYNRLKSINRSVALGAIALAATVALFPTAAVATPPEGVLSGTVFARGSFADPTNVKFAITGDPSNRCSKEVVRVRDAEETVVQQIVIRPGGNTGWHSHPGPVVVLVTAGQLSFYDSEDATCTVRTYSAGQVFVDSGQGHVHIARNQGSVNLELWATYFDVPPVDPSVPGSGAFRIDAPDPGNCSF